MSKKSDRLIIFDTTLRDGEQSPGASMNLAEKLQVAHALKDLGVDVIEAGFPIASPGDFESVQAIAREVHGPVICGLARCTFEDIDRAADAGRQIRIRWRCGRLKQLEHRAFRCDILLHDGCRDLLLHISRLHRNETGSKTGNIHGIALASIERART